MAPLDELQPWIDDALDLIEFANGDAQTTKWGAVRAKLGHEAPFGLEYIAVGNEEVGEPFLKGILTSIRQSGKNIPISKLSIRQAPLRAAGNTREVGNPPGKPVGSGG